jgi:hypothetical protein
MTDQDLQLIFGKISSLIASGQSLTSAVDQIAPQTEYTPVQLAVLYNASN